jgi:hypothetical protein
MSFLGNIFPFIGDSIGEITSHPLQAAGAALGVPGYDPFFGGLLNNKPGGALISPTGNFTSSAWQDMYNRNPGDAGALNQFSAINSVADKVAPMIAGYYAAPGIGAAMGGSGGAATGAGASAADVGGGGIGSGLGGAGMGTGATWGGAAASPVVGSGTAGLMSPGAGAGGIGGLLGGPAALGDAGLTGAVSAGGSGLGLMGGADMGSALGAAPTGLFSGVLPGGGMSGTASGALGGGMSGATAGAAPMGDATMGALNFNPNTFSQAQRLMQMGQQQPQQQQRMPMQIPMQQARFGNQRGPSGPIGPSMPYTSFNGAAPMNNLYGIGSAYGTL